MNRPAISHMRQAIDGIDSALADLLVCRAGLSKRVQAEKAQAGVAVLDPVREAEIRQRFDRAAPGLAYVASAILEWCRHED